MHWSDADLSVSRRGAYGSVDQQRVTPFGARLASVSLSAGRALGAYAMGNVARG